MMVSYYEGFIAKEIAKTLAKRGKTKKTGGKDGDLEKDREPRATYPTPPKSERIKRSRERQKEKEKDERAKERGPTVGVPVSAIRRRAKVISKPRPRSSAWSYKDTIAEVGMNYVKVGNYPGKIFQVKEITKIIKGTQQISLDDLKEGMDATVRYTMKDGNMVAKWIKVTGSRFPIRL